MPSRRSDTLAGRAFYVWDDANMREQLTADSDTGVRDVTAAWDAATPGILRNQWTAGLVTLHRVGYVVELGIGGLDPAAQTSATCMILPTGFRPAGTRIHQLPMRPPTGNAPLWAQVQGGGSVLAQTSGATHSSLATLTFITTDPWPTTLPGVPSGAIPNL